MKKRFLLWIGIFLCFTVFVEAQKNYINDVKYEQVESPFPTLVLSGIDNIEKGKWFFVAYNGHETTSDVTKEQDLELNKSVLVLKNEVQSGKSWYNPFLGQRIKQKVDSNKYRLGFWAKASADNVNVYTYIRIKKENEECFFILEGGSESGGASATNRNIKLNQEWSYYTVDFDFSTTCNTVWGSNKVFSIATEQDFEDCYLSIRNDTDNSSVYIRDIGLFKMDGKTFLDPGFEEDHFLPFLINTNINATNAQYAGSWIIGSNLGPTVNIVDEDRGDNFRSMQVNYDAKEDNYYTRFHMYMMNQLLKVSPGEYIFSFWSKASMNDVPFRLEILLYKDLSEGPGNIEVIRFNNDGSQFTEISNSANANVSGNFGSILYRTKENWTKYQVTFTVPDNKNEMVQFVFRPNCTGLGSNGLLAGAGKISYWFDDFSFEKTLEKSGTIGDIVLSGGWDIDQFNLLVPEKEKITTIDMTNVTNLATIPVLENLNPNCLFYVNPDVTGEGYNLVTVTEEGASASTITLSEGDYFNNTRAFNAGAVSYKRDFTDMPFASLLLPFVPENIDDIVLEEFKEVKVEGETTAIFEITENITANTPYIIKLGGSVGEKTFTASDVEIIATPAEISSGVSNGYVLKGNYQLIEGEEAIGLYLLRTDGTKFAVGTVESLVPAFRSYLEYVGEDAPAKSIGVEHGNDDGPTSIDIESSEKIFEIVSRRGEVEIYTTESQIVSLYALDGRILQRLILESGYNTVSNLSKGIYLINNQKVVVR